MPRELPIRFAVKLVVIAAILIFVGFIPGRIGNAIEIVLLFLLVAVLFVTSYAAVRDLGLLRIPGRNGPLRHVTYDGIQVFYPSELNGGGLGLSYEFVRLVSKHIGKVEHVHEYCCGPGFIGFHLLAKGLCSRLTLSDVNPRAVAAVRETIRRNGLEGRVTVYESDCLDTIPPGQTWDLIVSNPPWDIRTSDDENLILSDPGARVHKHLFRDAPQFLKPSGGILLVESHEYTSKKEMIQIAEGTPYHVTDYFPPTPAFKIMSKLDEYPGTRRSMAITLRLGMCFLELYLVLLRPRESS